MNNTSNQYIVVNESQGTVRIRLRLDMVHKYEDGFYFCMIPSLKLMFATQDVNQIRKRTEALLKCFFQTWIEQASVKGLDTELKHLGFGEIKIQKANHGQEYNPSRTPIYTDWFTNTLNKRIHEGSYNIAVG